MQTKEKGKPQLQPLSSLLRRPEGRKRQACWREGQEGWLLIQVSPLARAVLSLPHSPTQTLLTLSGTARLSPRRAHFLQDPAAFRANSIYTRYKAIDRNLLQRINQEAPSAFSPTKPFSAVSSNTLTPSKSSSTSRSPSKPLVWSKTTVEGPSRPSAT